jgi:lipoyl(octanoyl) transferase
MTAELPDGLGDDAALQVYLLGLVDFDAVLRLQRRLHYEISGDRTQAALILCEHPPTISVGRQGSRAHIHMEPEELATRRWPIRWVNRGGGCVLHGPGQIALYAILPLDRLGCEIPDYLHKLGDTICRLMGDFSLHAVIRSDACGVWAGERMLAAIGVSVRDWVTSYGAYINIHPALDLFRAVDVAGDHDQPMTSLERERRGPVRPSLVRERLIEHFRARFGFARIVLFSEHPLLNTGHMASTPPRRKSRVLPRSLEGA